MYEFIKNSGPNRCSAASPFQCCTTRKNAQHSRLVIFYLIIIHKATRHDAVAYDRCLLDLTDAVASALHLSGSGVKYCLFEKSSNKEIQCTTN